MKMNKFYKYSITAVTALSISIGNVTVANAQPITPVPLPPLPEMNIPELPLPPRPSIPNLQDEANEFLELVTDNVANVSVTDSSGTSNIKVTELNKTLGEILNGRDLDIADYRDNNNQPLDKDLIIEANADLKLYKNELSTDASEFIELAPNVIEEQDPNLARGEEVVEEEGEVGVAIKTITSQSNLSTANEAIDGAVNAINESVEETLTIIRAPKTRIVRVGTMALQSSSLGGDLQTRLNDGIGAISDYLNSALGAWARNGAAEIAELREINKGNEVMQTFIDQIGKPYVWGAIGPSSFDCSGLIYWVHNTVYGNSIPRVAGDQGAYSTPVSWDEIRPGDVLWKNNEHIGVYAGDGRVVHAANSSVGVVITDLKWFVDNGFIAGRL